MLRHLGIHTPSDWARLVSGLVVVFALFHFLASALGSDRGQWGLAIAITIVAATSVVDLFLLRRSRAGLVQRLGLARPRAEALAVALAAIFPLLLVALVLSLMQPSGSLTFHPGWIVLLPGLFAQAGIAEEVLFRAYLFGQIRIGRTFWRAATLAMVPFVAVHLVTMATLPWPVALAGLALSAVISFPLAYLYELGGNTVWAPALLHFVIQAVPKILLVRSDVEVFALIWTLAAVLVPLVVLAHKTE